MNEKRRIDFRFAPDIGQTCVSLADDPFKTIVREDGSLNYLWRSDQDLFVDGTVPACRKRVQSVQEGNRGFTYRCAPRFYHRDRLLSRRQDFGDPAEAVVETVEEYERCVFRWKTFGHRLPDGTRLDVMLFTLTAGEQFGHARENVYLQTMGEPFAPPETRRDPSLAYSLPSANAAIPAPIALYTPVERQDGTPAGAFLQAGETWEGAFALIYHGALAPEQFTLDFARSCLTECQRYWQQVRPFRHAFRVPDAQVRRMLAVCGRNILQAREIVDGIAECHVGPTIYRGLWVFDGYYFAECGYMMG
ncbi:MAG: hypothetical protein PHY12_14645, partial [Eubacteriales bacterium]|nr:hypothetical protein [Eubacteriales bacterium]